VIEQRSIVSEPPRFFSPVTGGCYGKPGLLHAKTRSTPRKTRRKPTGTFGVDASPSGLQERSPGSEIHAIVLVTTVPKAGGFFDAETPRRREMHSPCVGVQVKKKFSVFEGKQDR